MLDFPILSPNHGIRNHCAVCQTVVVRINRLREPQADQCADTSGALRKAQASVKFGRAKYSAANHKDDKYGQQCFVPTH